MANKVIKYGGIKLRNADYAKRNKYLMESVTLLFECGFKGKELADYFGMSYKTFRSLFPKAYLLGKRTKVSKEVRMVIYD